MHGCMPPRRFFGGEDFFFGLAGVVSVDFSVSGTCAVVVPASAFVGGATTVAGVVCPDDAGSSAAAGIEPSSEAAVASDRSAANRVNPRERKAGERIRVVFTSHGYVERSNLLPVGQTLLGKVRKARSVARRHPTTLRRITAARGKTTLRRITRLLRISGTTLGTGHAGV